MQRHYRAFISYSHVDEKWASWLHRSLERFRVPRKLEAGHNLQGKRLAPVFRDRDELSSSSSLSAEIEAALEASDYLLVVCSRSAAQSHWVNEEVLTFKSLGRHDRILCLIVDGKDGEYFPPALKNDEPLGADVRTGADGKQNAKLKIIARMLGVRFAELNDRQARRRNQVFGFAAAGSLAIAGVMSALAINAVIAGREAEQSRVMATEALAEAEQVAGFLSSMLAEIDPEAMGQTILEDIRKQAPSASLPVSISSTDTARRLLDQHLLSGATNTVREQFANRPSINARLERSIGDSYHAIGLYSKAVEVGTTAAQRYREVYGPFDERTLSADYALALSRIYEGQLEQAITELEQNLASVQRELGPDHEQTALTMTGLAIGYLDIGRNQDARDLLEQAEAVYANQQDIESEILLSIQGSLAWALYLLEDYAAAEQLNLELLSAQRQTLGPESVEELNTLNNLALVYRQTGRYEQAEQMHQKELTIARRVMGSDHPEVLISMLNLSRVLNQLERLTEAHALLYEAYETAASVLPETHPLRAAITFAYADSTLSNGDTDQALRLYRIARSIYEQLFEPDHPVFSRLDEQMTALETQ